MVKDPLGKRVPHGGIDRLEARKLGDGVAQLGAKLVVGFRAAREADDGERLRELAFVGEIVKCRDELAVGEVARRPEDDQRARLWRPSCTDAFAKRIRSKCVLHCHDPGQNYHTYDAGRKRAVSGHDWFGTRKGFRGAVFCWKQMALRAKCRPWLRREAPASGSRTSPKNRRYRCRRSRGRWGRTPAAWWLPNCERRSANWLSRRITFPIRRRN